MWSSQWIADMQYAKAYAVSVKNSLNILIGKNDMYAQHKAY